MSVEWFEAPDAKQNMRKAILFELVPLVSLDSANDEPSESSSEVDQESRPESLAELRRKPLADSAESRKPV
jgi:hypothetical protein